ncbi:MAG: hypothetical protein IKB73_02830 [Ruminococcus sp.]|nr:hypothetical protein [Ruminococcus sp.]
MKKGLFKGEDMLIDCGGGTLLTCCKDCYAEYGELQDVRKDRFGTKLINMKRAKRIKKLSEAEIAKMYTNYIDEERKQTQKCLEAFVSETVGIFTLTQNGLFSVREFATDFLNSDIGAKDMIKSLDKAQYTACLYFDKNDITKIEYAKVGMSSPLGLFAQAYSFAIRLNDEAVITYKPCITRIAMVGRGFIFGYQRNAEAKLVDQLNYIKKKIGSDLPIVKVKKI